MASVLDIDIPFVVKFRFHAVIVAGKSCLCAIPVTAVRMTMMMTIPLLFPTAVTALP